MSSSRRLRLARLVVLAASLLPVTPLAAAPGTAPAAKVPVKEAPADVAELRALEAQVQKVLAKAIPCTVGIRVGPAQGSGVIISEDGYVLTAGHVSGKPGQDVAVILPSGKQLKAKSLGQNRDIDSGMIKITDPGPFPFAEMGRSSALQRGQWVISIGHPGGFRTVRSPVVRLGRVLTVNPFLIHTDCTLVGGDSGGPLFDLDGKVVGIHSRIGGLAITDNIHVPVDTYRDTWDRLAKGESWGERLGADAAVRSAGGKVVFEKRGELTRDDPKDKQPGAHQKVYTLTMKAGATYTIDLYSRQFDAFLRLEDAAGKQLAEDDDGAGGTNARIVHRVLRDGEYRIVVTSFEPEQFGGFRLRVQEADKRDEFQTGRVDVLQAVRLPKQIAAVVVSKLAQEGKPLQVNAALVDEAGKPAAGIRATVVWKGGKDVITADAQGLIRWRLAKDRLKELSLEVPAGTKTLLALTDAAGNPFNPRIGGDSDLAREKVKSAGGEIVLQTEGTLAKSDPFDTQLRESHAKIHEIKLLPGGAYTIDLQSEDFDAFLRLEDSKGKQLAEDDDGAGYLNSRIVFRTNEAGTFRIVATSFDGGQTGQYRLVVRRAEGDGK